MARAIGALRHVIYKTDPTARKFDGRRIRGDRQENESNMNSRYPLTIILALAMPAMVLSNPLRAQDDANATAEPLVNRDVEALLETKPSTPPELIRAAWLFAEFERPDLGKKMLSKFMAARPTNEQLIQLVEDLGKEMFLDIGAQKSLAPEGEKVAGAAMAAIKKQARDPKRIDGLIGDLQDPSIDVRSAAMAELSRATGTSVGRIMEAVSDPAREAEHANLWAALVQLGPGAVDPLLGVLDRSDPRLMTQAARALGQLKSPRATEYLLGPYVSEKSDPKLRQAAGRALLRIVGQVPKKYEAVDILKRRVGEYLADRQVLKTNPDGNVEIWSWDESTKRCQSQFYTSHQANRIVAFRLARDAFALAPEDKQVKTLYLIAMLEAEVAQRQASGTVVDDAAEDKDEDSVLGRITPFGVPALEEALRQAMADNNVGAAAEAARLLGKAGTANELLYGRVEPSPLVAAVRHPEPRVRAAALEAIVRLQPSKGFAGSSYVPQALTFFVSTGGGPRILLVGPRANSSRRFASVLNEVGYDVDTATSGSEAIRKATATADYELAMIEMTIDDPPVKFLLQRLRGDYRTARLRIGLVARDGRLRPTRPQPEAEGDVPAGVEVDLKEDVDNSVAYGSVLSQYRVGTGTDTRGEQLKRAERLAGKDPLAVHFSRPHTADAFRWQLNQLDELEPLMQVSPELRQYWAAVSLQQLTVLKQTSGEVYDLSAARQAVLDVLSVPKLSSAAIGFLKIDNLPASQLALVEVVSRGSLPLELRREALAGLRFSIESHGILLTTAEIQRQYDRYNASADMDENTQHLLGLVLDCLEAPTEEIRVKKKEESKQ